MSGLYQLCVQFPWKRNKTTIHGGQISPFNILNPEGKALSQDKALSLWASLTELSLLPACSLFTAYPERGKGHSAWRLCTYLPVHPVHRELESRLDGNYHDYNSPVELVEWAPKAIPQACQTTALICLWKAVLIKRGNYNIKCQALVCKLLSHRILSLIELHWSRHAASCTGLSQLRRAPA